MKNIIFLALIAFLYSLSVDAGHGSVSPRRSYSSPNISMLDFTVGPSKVTMKNDEAEEAPKKL
ncbi:MAG: hypothetical protein ACPGXY_06810, partial [Alphaproteobacteria bacterium]